MIEATIHQGVVVNTPDPEVRNPKLVRCFRHEGEACPHCDGSGYQPRKLKRVFLPHALRRMKERRISEEEVHRA